MLTEQLAREYLAECEYRGLARPTAAQYGWALRRLNEKCPTIPPERVDLIKAMSDPTLKSESQKDVRKCLKTFFGWVERNYKVTNPCTGMAMLVRRRELPRVLSVEEVHRLVRVAKIERDRALLLVILDCGLRLGEVAGIRRRDIGDGWLAVSGKVGRRQVPISAGMQNLLGQIGNGEDVWLGRIGRLTKGGVSLVYRHLFKAAGIVGPETGAHTLRHTFGTWYIGDGGGWRQLQDILGHRDIKTTMVYVNLAGVDTQSDHAIHTPTRTLGLLD